MRRTVLHCDLDNFFASVESVYDPSLKNVPFAVCGDPGERRGIVLAKNSLAKQSGVKTAVPIWAAERLCPKLKIVSPHYDRYEKFSREAKKIYKDYADAVEPFGIDECWLDATGEEGLFGSGTKIAEEIRERIKKELGLTVSIGVSFNKIFAKLGSDLNKPDGISVVTEKNFRSVVWPLPAESLLYVGKAAGKKLGGMGVLTVGDAAAIGRERLLSAMGKNGEKLWTAAMGLDFSPVLRESETPAPKSAGKSVTGIRDFTSDDEIFRAFLSLARDVSRTLRERSLLCGEEQITIKNAYFCETTRRKKLLRPTRLALELAETGMELFKKNRSEGVPIRAVGMRASALVSERDGAQLFFEYDYEKADKIEKLEACADAVAKKYGNRALVRASSLYEQNFPERNFY